MRTVHVTIIGKVQGVWFRASTKEEAGKYHVNGWVKNTTDGAVEAVFQGENAQVDQVLSWCNNGPPLSYVDQVIIKEISDEKTYSEFSIRY